MNKLLAIGIPTLIIFLLIGGCSVSTLNKDAILGVTIKKKEMDNTSEFDNMKKKISGVAEVSNEAMEKLRQIYVEHAEARTSDNGGSLAKWVTESIPNVSASTYDKLINTITSSRDAWTMRQKELIDLSREQESMHVKFPSNIALKLFDRKPVEIKVITSANTKEAFRTGEDNDDSVFKKPTTQLEK